MLHLVPNTLREAAVALGAPMWKVILMVTLKAARGVITGPCASPGCRARRAPLLFTALNNHSSPPTECADGEPAGGDLPVRVEPIRGLKTLAWAGALLITLAVLVINILARSVFQQHRFVRTYS